MKDIKVELEKSMLIAQIKMLLGNVEMWQNSVNRWLPMSQNNQEIQKHIRFARAKVALNLAKIKMLIRRFEQC